MPTTITVPVGQRTKSVKFGAPYSPSLSFNPDKKLFYDCSGVLTGMGLTINTAPTPDEVTVGIGSFIQRGVIVNITSAQLVQFPNPTVFPVYLVAENQNEIEGSNVTVLFTQTPASDSCVIAQWLQAPVTEPTIPLKISIREIRDILGGIAQLVIKREHQAAAGGQTVFNLLPNNSYTVGANKIWVFKNGKKLELGIDFTETSPTQVTLTGGAIGGDFMEFKIIRSAPPITSVALNDLTDMTVDLASAVKDTGVLRTAPATAANPLATIQDITSGILAGTYFSMRTKVDSDFSTGSDSYVVVTPQGGGGNWFSETLSIARKYVFFAEATVANNSGTNAQIGIRINGTDHPGTMFHTSNTNLLISANVSAMTSVIVGAGQAITVDLVVHRAYPGGTSVLTANANQPIRLMILRNSNTA